MVQHFKYNYMNKQIKICGLTIIVVASIAGWVYAGLLYPDTIGVALIALAIAFVVKIIYSTIKDILP